MWHRGPLDIFAYWISDQFATATWNLGSAIVSLGLTAREGIPITFFAFFMIGIILTLNGRIGAMTHRERVLRQYHHVTHQCPPSFIPSHCQSIVRHVGRVFRHNHAVHSGLALALHPYL